MAKAGDKKRLEENKAHLQRLKILIAVANVSNCCHIVHRGDYKSCKKTNPPLISISLGRLCGVAHGFTKRIFKQLAFGCPGLDGLRLRRLLFHHCSLPRYDFTSIDYTDLSPAIVYVKIRSPLEFSPSMDVPPNLLQRPTTLRLAN